jgi:hypothetical protein
MTAAPRAVAIYIRWSTDEQTEGTTLEVQRERCSLFIRAQGWAYDPNLTLPHARSTWALSMPMSVR